MYFIHHIIYYIIAVTIVVALFASCQKWRENTFILNLKAGSFINTVFYGARDAHSYWDREGINEILASGRVLFPSKCLRCWWLWHVARIGAHIQEFDINALLQMKHANLSKSAWTHHKLSGDDVGGEGEYPRIVYVLSIIVMFIFFHLPAVSQ